MVRPLATLAGVTVMAMAWAAPSAVRLWSPPPVQAKAMGVTVSV